MENNVPWKLMRRLFNDYLKLYKTHDKKKKKQETDTVCQHSCKKVRRKIMYFQLYLPKRNSKRTYQKIIKALPEKKIK